MTLPVQELGTPEDAAPLPETERKKIAGRSPTRIAVDRLRKDKIAVVCFAIVVIFALIAIFADQLCSLFGVSTETVRASERVNLASGLPLKGPPNGSFDPDHPLGVAPSTGTDNLAVWFEGCRTSLFLATMAAVLSTLVGVTLGLLAGFLGGVVDAVISFVTDLFLTFPFLVAALAIAPIINERFGTEPEMMRTVSFWSLVAILVIFGWMGVARLVRGEVLSLREREFVKAARVIGVPTSRILRREMLPNLIAPIVVSFSLGLPAYVAAEAGLSYLGIGVFGRESWGRTINTATNWWELYPQFMLAPVIGIAVLVVALNLLGDAIRDAFDPKTRR
ncbi:ABC transporter permease [Nocardioides sp. cx-173]|uniref:ABC transporter permease n=1 Tax=Nocardioides sp. cx-173 TaxID=2898796 RepID=UPI001E47BDDB|nr:ABC transporter permease [Nocardioides sp. cx-173]MCD4526053.1 ABC transporter permease [Nocardioides sp. cx-173]UGB43748.1 ABC transporter permease [Nocardioides sp. cx-173]